MSTNNKQPTYGLLCFAKKDTNRSPNQVTTEPSKEGTCPEIHLNIWEPNIWESRKLIDVKKVKNSASMLDIGFMFYTDDTTESVELIFPERVSLESVKDLSGFLFKSQAIPAIFNESWAIAANGSHGPGVVVYDPTERKPSFAVVDATKAMTETDHDGHHALSLPVSQLINDARSVSKSTGRDINRVYVRFRVLEFKKEYYCVGARDGHIAWWQPTWQKTEDIDFRLNIRRGVPPGLEQKIGSFLDFSKVHLFLMRSREKDIIFQDKLFNASRSLEDEDFWAQYILQETPPSNKASLEHVKQSVKNSLSYHWKKSNDSNLVKEFSTLARFKVVEFGLWKFIGAALFINVLGNMFYAELGDCFDQEPLAHIAQAQPVQREEVKPTKHLLTPSVGKTEPEHATAGRLNTEKMAR